MSAFEILREIRFDSTCLVCGGSGMFGVPPDRRACAHCQMWADDRVKEEIRRAAAANADRVESLIRELVHEDDRRMFDEMGIRWVEEPR